MKMRAKLQVAHVKKHSETCQEVRFHAVSKKDGYGEDGTDEDNTFSTFTPQAELTITITNPALVGAFREGEKYYADFTLAEKAPAPVEAEKPADPAPATESPK